MKVAWHIFFLLEKSFDLKKSTYIPVFLNFLWTFTLRDSLIYYFFIFFGNYTNGLFSNAISSSVSAVPSRTASFSAVLHEQHLLLQSFKSSQIFSANNVFLSKILTRLSLKRHLKIYVQKSWPTFLSHILLLNLKRRSRRRSNTFDVKNNNEIYRLIDTWQTPRFDEKSPFN